MEKKILVHNKQISLVLLGSPRMVFPDQLLVNSTVYFPLFEDCLTFNYYSIDICSWVKWTIRPKFCKAVQAVAIFLCSVSRTNLEVYNVYDRQKRAKPAALGTKPQMMILAYHGEWTETVNEDSIYRFLKLAGKTDFFTSGSLQK